MMWYDRTKLIKKHKLGILSQRPVGATKNGNPMTKDYVKDVIPQSDELKALLPELRALDAEKKEAKRSRA